MRIVEFGPSSNPIYEYSERIANKLELGTTYVGIDIKSKSFRDTSQEERGRFVLGDLRKIPLLDFVADEIWLMNVFGGDFTNSPERLSDGSLRYTLGISKYFQGMTRILKPGGTIYIGEWYPRIHKVDWIKEADYEEYGLTKEVYEGENVKAFLKEHEMSIEQIEEDIPSLFVVLTKRL